MFYRAIYSQIKKTNKKPYLLLFKPSLSVCTITNKNADKT